MSVRARQEEANDDAWGCMARGSHVSQGWAGGSAWRCMGMHGDAWGCKILQDEKFDYQSLQDVRAEPNHP